MHITQPSGYMDKLPQDILPQAALGAALTATVSFVFGATLPIAALGATLAATITVVEALARPIIKEIFKDYPRIARGVQFILPYSVVLGTLPLIGLSYKITSSVITCIALLILNLEYLNNSRYSNNAIAWVL